MESAAGALGLVGVLLLGLAAVAALIAPIAILVIEHRVSRIMGHAQRTEQHAKKVEIEVSTIRALLQTARQPSLRANSTPPPPPIQSA